MADYGFIADKLEIKFLILYITFVVIFVYFLVDILYRVIDPRISSK